MTVATDGFNTNRVSLGGGATSTVAASLTTTKANEILIAYVAVSSTTARTVSSITGGGLTWTRRKAFTNSTLYNAFIPTSGYTSDFEVWWAVAPTVLSAVTFTANLSGNLVGSNSEAWLLLFGVSGANNQSPWDTNASEPVSASVSSGVGSPISTTAAHVLLIGGSYINNLISGMNMQNPGFASSSAVTNIAAFAHEQTSVVTNSTLVESSTSRTNWMQYADAIVAAPQVSITSIATLLKGFTQSVSVEESIPTSIDQTLAGFTQAASVAESFPTSISQTLFGFTQEADITQSVPTHIAQTLLGFSQEADVAESMPSSISQTLPGFAQEVDAAVVAASATGTIEQTLTGFAQEADVTESIPTTLDQTLLGFSQEADVTQSFPTSIDQTLLGFTQEADVVSIAGSIDQTLAGFTQEADVVESFPNSIDQTLAGFSQEADVAESIPTHIDQTLAGFSQEADVAESLPTRINQTLRGFAQAASMDVENPAGAVFGEIAITFQGFSQRADTEIILPVPVADEHEGERGRGGGSAPKEIPPHEWEVDLFRAKEYRRNFDMAVPPVVIANVALGSIASPQPRPASIPLPPFVKPQ